MNNDSNKFRLPILNLISVPLIVLSLTLYYLGEFNIYLIFATIVVLINFDNNWYRHWIVLVFSGPIFANLFINNTVDSISRYFIRDIGILLIGILVYSLLVSLLKDFFQYMDRKKIIRTYKENLNDKVISILDSLESSNVDFNLTLTPLSEKLKVNDERKAKKIEELADTFQSQLKTLEFKDTLFGNDNRKIFLSLRKYLEIKNLLNNYKINNTNSSMSIFKDIKKILERYNINLESIEKVYKVMDYEFISRLQREFLKGYNTCVLNPKKSFFIQGMKEYNSYKYIENIQLKINDTIIELEDIIISDNGVFLLKKYHDPIKIYKLQFDISGELIKFYNSGDVEVDNDINSEITSKAKFLEKYINLKLVGQALNSKSIVVTPIIIVDYKDIIIENQSTINIIQRSKLGETIESFKDKQPKGITDSIVKIISSLIPDPPTLEYEFPSLNILNLIPIGLFTMSIIDELYEVIFKRETVEFINKYKP